MIPNIRKNNKALSPLATVIVLLVVVVLLWEVVGSYFGFGISDVFGTSEENVYFNIHVQDKINNQQYFPTNTSTTWIYHEQGHTYRLVVNTNAPFKITNPYKIIVEGFYSWTNDTTYTEGSDIWIQRDVFSIGVSGVLQDTFYFDLDTWYRTHYDFWLLPTDVYNFYNIQCVSPTGYVYVDYDYGVFIHKDLTI